MRAVVYARWSSLEQGKGSSLERQVTLCERLCHDKGWEIVDRIRDEGRSAFTGANLKDGQLAKFTERLELGLQPEGTILVVEQLDRISRLPPLEVMSWLERVIRHGLTIATANDGLVLNAEKLKADQIGFVSTVFNAFRAFQESKHKSERLTESWRIRREAAENEGRPITSVCPAWLTLDTATRKFSKIPERIRIVKRIFDEHIDGFGKRKIASRLNAEGISPWGRGKSKGDGWHPSYIQKILSNPAVLGEYQPHKRPRGGKREAFGDPIRDYYPAVIDEITFARANSGRRRLPGGAAKGNLSNLFSGRTRCVCGGKMIYIKKQSAGSKKKNRVGDYVWTVGADESYLVCGRALRHVNCHNRNHFNYQKVEAGVIDRVNHLILGDEPFAQPEEALRLEQEVVAVERHVASRKAKSQRLLNLYGETNNPDAKRMWLETENDVAKLEQQLVALREQFLVAKGAVSPEEHVRRIKEFVGLVNDADPDIRLDARRKTMTALNEVVDFISFDKDRKATVVFLGGAHNIMLSDKGVVEQERSFLVELSQGDRVVTLGDGTALVAPISALRAGLVGDDPLRQSNLDKLLDRDSRYRAGASEILAEERTAEDG